jgi:hypothetical protein
MIETFPPIFSAALLYYIEVQHIIVEKLKNNLKQARHCDIVVISYF